MDRNITSLFFPTFPPFYNGKYGKKQTKPTKQFSVSENQMLIVDFLPKKCTELFSTKMKHDQYSNIIDCTFQCLEYETLQ